MAQRQEKEEQRKTGSQSGSSSGYCRQTGDRERERESDLCLSLSSLVSIHPSFLSLSICLLSFACSIVIDPPSLFSARSSVIILNASSSHPHSPRRTRFKSHSHWQTSINDIRKPRPPWRASLNGIPAGCINGWHLLVSPTMKSKSRVYLSPPFFHTLGRTKR
jgi:hypothetical protein